ncbi:hypothetical protein XELAEV_18037736mg [Xenopus laevis]|uniref:Uncharacterized protein n=1 Tax=Xenopus laevis TaxID=8355 RepID=A0A974CDB6_XENLA|nr:hypothetical protein XELAEV_18037736mg [Xenopus laevis]
MCKAQGGTSFNRSRIDFRKRGGGGGVKASNSKRQTIRLPREGVGLRWRQIEGKSRPKTILLRKGGRRERRT